VAKLAMATGHTMIPDSHRTSQLVKGSASGEASHGNWSYYDTGFASERVERHQLRRFSASYNFSYLKIFTNSVMLSSV
jgi:carbohydrate-binding DOMON domain-containing protein